MIKTLFLRVNIRRTCFCTCWASYTRQIITKAGQEYMHNNMKHQLYFRCTEIYFSTLYSDLPLCHWFVKFKQSKSLLYYAGILLPCRFACIQVENSFIIFASLKWKYKKVVFIRNFPRISSNNNKYFRVLE